MNLLGLLVVLHVLIALAIIGLVLLQHGKGADMGSGFGGGASGSLFGATGSANFLSRTTAVLAGVFFILSLSLTYVASSGRTTEAGGGGGVIDAARKQQQQSKPAPNPQQSVPEPSQQPAQDKPAAQPAPAQGAAPAETPKDKQVPQ